MQSISYVFHYQSFDYSITTVQLSHYSDANSSKTAYSNGTSISNYIEQFGSTS